MRTKTLGEGKSELRLPASLALLHHVTAVGEQVKVRLAPNPSQAWTQDRAQDLIVGAGFELAGSCSLNQGAALVRIRRIQSLPADQQCAVADRVVDAKERLKGALKAHLLARPDPAAPVTPEDVHAAVRSMAAARPDEGSLSDEESVRSEQEGY